MNEIIEKLRRDFSVSCCADDNRIKVSSSWKGKTPGVSVVRFRLEGEDPKTGEELPSNAFSGYFSKITDSATSNILEYDGTFYIHFDAELSSGESVKDFRAPCKVEMECTEGKPRLEYELMRVKKEWYKLRITNCNCPRMVSGKLWIRNGDISQLLPPINGETMICYLPFPCEGAEIDAPKNVICKKK